MAVPGTGFVTAGVQHRPRLNDDACVPTGVGHSHAISILLLFISHLGKAGRQARSPWYKEDSKATVFVGAVKCAIKPFKRSSTHRRLKTNVAFRLSMGTT